MSVGSAANPAVVNRPKAAAKHSEGTVGTPGTPGWVLDISESSFLTLLLSNFVRNHANTVSEAGAKRFSNVTKLRYEESLVALPSYVNSFPRKANKNSADSLFEIGGPAGRMSTPHIDATELR